MIYTDGVHLISDKSIDELHVFAIRIGLKPAWFQDNPRHPHYDLLSMRMRARAVREGAQRVDKKTLLRIIKKTSRATSGKRRNKRA